MLDAVVRLGQALIVEEEYRETVLFYADAGDDVFAGLVGREVLGRKPQPGRPGRTTGQYATSFKSKVLPDFLTVVDDPTMKEFQGHSLVGSYDVDSEGVKAAPVKVIDKGQLINYLVGREPIRDFPESNGHARAAFGPCPLPPTPNLFVRAENSHS